MEEAVIDTNVFLHASNPMEERMQPARDLLTSMLTSPTKLCVDEGFHLDPLKCESRIFYEYIDKIRHSLFAYPILTYLAQSGYIKQIPRWQDDRLKTVLTEMVKDATDRVFVDIANSSNSKVLITHDYKDFPHDLRDAIHQKFGLCFTEASTVSSGLSCTHCAGTHTLR